MYNSIRIVFLLMVMSILMISCSGGGNPITPPVGDQKESANGMPEVAYGQVPISERAIDDLPSDAILGPDSTFQSTGILGGWDLIIYDDLTSELVPMRRAALGESYLVSGASFFTVRPCPDCLIIKSIELTPDGKIRVVFWVSHPFEKGNKAEPPSGKNRLDLDLFDLSLVIVPYSASFKNFAKTNTIIYNTLCEGMDGFTAELSALTHNPNVCPYYLVVDDTETSEPTFNKFEMGTKNKELEVFITGTGRFNLFLTMGYGVSATLSTRLSPVYFNPEFNKKSAWKVDVIPPQGSDPPAYGNTWSNDDPTTEYNVRVVIYDWQQNATVSDSYPDISNTNHIYKRSKVESVSAEVLNMMNTLQTSRRSVSGEGTVTDPVIFDVALRNENLLAAGVYPGLVKVTDERSGGSGKIGEVDSLIHVEPNGEMFWYPISQFATYQLFKATVVVGDTIRVTSPNGGETWAVGSSKTVMWTSTGTTTFVNIELSLDSGQHYTVPIAASQPNSGSYNIPSVGNWETQHARIRVYNTFDNSVIDESDADFTIESTQMPIEVTAPNGGEVWPKGTQQNITWNADSGILYVKIMLSKDSGATYDYPITGSTANDGVFEWNIPQEAVSATCRIKVQHLTNPFVFDTSDADFEILCPLLNAPGNFNASDDAYNDKVVVTWSQVGDATGYNLYRDGVLQQANYGGTLWEDNTVVPGTIYYYQIEVINTCGTGPIGPAAPGEAGSACVVPSAPTWCTASDGTFPDRIQVSWEAIALATSYDIYRDGNSTPFATGILTETWDDTSIILCDHHDYEVVAVSGCGESVKSPSDNGYSEYFTAEPQNVQATDGDFHNKVTITWDAVPGALTYNIYRDSVLLQANVGLVVTWDDMTTIQGVIYYYKVAGVNQCGEGALGPAGLGEPGNTCIPLPAPASCTASDDTYADHVEVAWDIVPGATGYNVYRDGNPTPVAANEAGLTWDDYAVNPCEPHDYTVTTLSTCGESTPCASNQGTSFELPVAPLNVAASDDSYPDKVTITWNAAPDASTYNIFRDTLLYQANVGNVLTWDDTVVTPGQIYDYQVQTVSLCGAGGTSVADPGNACVLPGDPTNVSATDDVFPDKVVLTWDPVVGAQYNIYRNSVLMVGSYVPTSWNDLTATPGVVYFYQVEAFNGCGISARIPADPGEPGNACVLPGDPSGLTATDGTFPDRVELSWTAGAGATSYNIYRNTALYDTSPVNSYADMGANPGTLYSYEVEAVNSCGVSASKSNADDGWAVTCLPDTNDTCGTADQTNLVNHPLSGCASQVDSDWFHLYVPPNGIQATSTIDFSGLSDNVDVVVYGFDPGGGPCPGNVITSGTDIGNGSFPVPASAYSHIYIKLNGHAGEVVYTMEVNFVPVITSVPIAINIATDDGTPTGNMPYNGSVYLTLATVNQMITWGNLFWNQYGYELYWDGTTWTCMSDQYYVLSGGELGLMRSTYHHNPTQMDLYFVSGGVSTAFCIVQSSKAAHNVNNVYTVYGPSVWDWQAVVAHEHGHGLGYFYDQYLYDYNGCACGDNVCMCAAEPGDCISGEPYLYWNDYGCYAGDLMYYEMLWNWNQYNINWGQNQWFHQFNFDYVSNYPWF
jgi:fibronectin type 3 domain-containing protein